MSTPKTKKEKEMPNATKVNAGSLIADRAAVLEHADEILEEMFRDDRPANFEELDFLTSVVGWSRTQQNENYRRVARRVRLQQIAGTSQDRDDLKKFSESAQAAFEAKGPELLDQITKLQAEHAKLEKTATSSARRFEETQNALQELTQVCSPSVAAAVASRCSAIEHDLGQHVSDLRGKLHQIENILKGPEAQRHNLGWDQLRKFDESLVITTVTNGMISYSFSPAWPAAKAKMQAEIPGRQVEIERMQKLLDEALEKAREPLRQYWR